MLIMTLKQMRHLLIMKLLIKMKQLRKNLNKKKLNQKKPILSRKQKHYQELKKKLNS